MCQLKGLYESFGKKGFGDVLSNLDSIEWSSPHTYLRKENLDMRHSNNPFQMLVLRKPLSRIVLAEVKDCKGSAVHVSEKTKQKEAQSMNLSLELQQ